MQTLRKGKIEDFGIIFPNLTLPNVTSFNKHRFGHLVHFLWSAFRHSRLDVILRIVATKILKTFPGKYHRLFQLVCMLKYDKFNK